MALLVDGSINTIDDLLVIDHNILALAEVERVNLTQKLNLAQTLAEQEVSAILESSAASSRPKLGQIMVTPILETYHALLALEKAYQDAYLSQGLERYEKAWQFYRSEGQMTLRKAVKSGLAFCLEPLARPKAPNVSVQSGLGPAGVVEVFVAWTNSRGQHSALSQGVAIANISGDAITVQPTDPPVFATGWHAYLAQDGAAPKLQAGPIDLGQAWISTSAEIVDLGTPTSDQPVEAVYSAQPRLQRG